MRKRRPLCLTFEICGRLTDVHIISVLDIGAIALVLCNEESGLERIFICTGGENTWFCKMNCTTVLQKRTSQTQCDRVIGNLSEGTSNKSRESLNEFGLRSMLCAKTLASGLGAKFQAYEAIPGHCSLVYLAIY